MAKLDASKPFRVTIEHYDTKISVEVNRSDVKFEEAWDMLRQAVLAAGFSAEIVNEYFGE
jgi:hypothetical protein